MGKRHKQVEYWKERLKIKEEETEQLQDRLHDLVLPTDNQIEWGVTTWQERAEQLRQENVELRGQLNGAYCEGAKFEQTAEQLREALREAIACIPSGSHDTACPLNPMHDDFYANPSADESPDYPRRCKCPTGVVERAEKLLADTPPDAAPTEIAAAQRETNEVNTAVIRRLREVLKQIEAHIDCGGLDANELRRIVDSGLRPGKSEVRDAAPGPDALDSEKWAYVIETLVGGLDYDGIRKWLANKETLDDAVTVADLLRSGAYT